jgi:hypothetical protein
MLSQAVNERLARELDTYREQHATVRLHCCALAFLLSSAVGKPSRYVQLARRLAEESAAKIAAANRTRALEAALANVPTPWLWPL